MENSIGWLELVMIRRFLISSKLSPLHKCCRTHSFHFASIFASHQQNDNENDIMHSKCYEDMCAAYAHTQTQWFFIGVSRNLNISGTQGPHHAFSLSCFRQNIDKEMDPSKSIHFICSLKLLKFNGMEKMNNFDVCWNDNLFNVSIQKFSRKKTF